MLLPLSFQAASPLLPGDSWLMSPAIKSCPLASGLGSREQAILCWYDAKNAWMDHGQGVGK